jgi:hypothetical protein
MQGYLNFKGYGEFDAANRPAGWNTWLTFAISPAAPSDAMPTRHLVTKQTINPKMRSNRCIGTDLR